jgi:O-acetyl-ADP-ribose deacetylase (regulator of RNase III)
MALIAIPSDVVDRAVRLAARCGGIQFDEELENNRHLEQRERIIVGRNFMTRLMQLMRSSFATGLVAAVLLSGCGGSSALSHTQLVTRASTACRQADDTASRLPRPQAGSLVSSQSIPALAGALGAPACGASISSA